MSTTNLPDLLRVAKEAVLEAAAHLKSQQADLSRATSFEGRDIKLRGDIALNEIIVRALRGSSRIPILSEESESQPLSAIDYTWILDPLDGSFNFHRGIPFYGISLALWKGFKPLLGVFHDSVRGCLYHSIVDSGCFLDGRSITVSREASPSQSVLCTGFPLHSNYSESSLLKVVRQVRTFKKIRMLGSAAASLALVASGSAEAYSENRIAIWDVAAGIALVKAAGGRVWLEKTDDHFRFNVYAANPALSLPPPFESKEII